MTENDNYRCVVDNPYALATLIRVCWMSYTGAVLDPTSECQLTKLHSGQWQELHRYCENYDKCTERTADSNPIKQPAIMLLYALSELQVYDRTSEGFKRARSILKSIHDDAFVSQPRMRTLFMICNESGDPVKYSGTVSRVEKNGGFIKVNDYPGLNDDGHGVRFYSRNLGRGMAKHNPGEVFGPELELGIGYTSFSVYTEEGRKEKEGRQ